MSSDNEFDDGKLWIADLIGALKSYSYKYDVRVQQGHVYEYAPNKGNKSSGSICRIALQQGHVTFMLTDAPLPSLSTFM
jgi:hypothetical protein